MKNKLFVSQSWAGLLLILLAGGCAGDRFNWFGSTSNANNSGMVHHQSPSGSRGFMTQKLCPVTGEPLDSMGGAIPVNANGETIYVCCQGCVKTVNKDPKKYLAIIRSES